MASHELGQLEPDAIGMLVRMLIQEEFDALLLFSIAPVIDDVALHTSEHLAELACDALSAVLDDSRQVGVGPCILIGQLVSILVPHLLDGLRDEGVLLWATEPRVRVELAARVHLCLLQVV